MGSLDPHTRARPSLPVHVPGVRQEVRSRGSEQARWGHNDLEEESQGSWCICCHLWMLLQKALRLRVIWPRQPGAKMFFLLP